MVNLFSIIYCVTTFLSDMISNNEQKCPVKTSFMQITTFKASKTNFMLFTELYSTMIETGKKSNFLATK